MGFMKHLGFVSKKEHVKALAENEELREVVAGLLKENRRLIDLCDEKDAFFKEIISDALRHGSSKGAKHMADLKQYLKGR